MQGKYLAYVSQNGGQGQICFQIPDISSESICTAVH